MRPIERLSVFGLELPAEAARTLMAGIPTHCEPTALSKLMISATSPGWRMRAEDVCTSLTSLMLNMCERADIADVEYESLADRCPPLQRVEFPGSYYWAVFPRCTIAALGHLRIGTHALALGEHRPPIRRQHGRRAFPLPL